MRGRLEALLLLALGAGAFVFARGPRYTALMNPTFCWVTLSGSVLVVCMGVALLLVPRRTRNRSAFLAFGLLAALIALGRPDIAEGVSIQPPDAAPAPTREGYEALLLESLFRTLSEEVDDVPESGYVVQGRLHPVPSGGFVLLYPKVTCCLADALAYAVHLDLPQGVAPPEGAAWVYVYGTLRHVEEPISTPPFRMGAILYTAVSRHYRLEVDDIVDYRALLEDVTAKIPEDPCSAYRAALVASGLHETLRGEGPFTVFAPVDGAFSSGRTDVEDFVVPGRLSREDLFTMTSVVTLSGRTLTIEVVNGKLLVEGARILFADQAGRNGVVHIVHPAWPP